MFDDIVKFFQNLLKSKKPGVTQSETGQSILKTTAEEAKKTDITDPALTGKYDPTTPPGQFKEQKPIIDEEGNIKTRVVSYTPESFTDTQKRQGVGSFSDKVLTERYFDEGFENTMGLEEFIIKERGITQEARAAELREKGRIGTLERSDEDPDLMVKKKIEPETIKFITNIAKSTGRSEEDVRQAIVNRMNEAYEMNDPKITLIDDDASISAYIDNQVTMDEMGFAQELIDDVLENYPIQGMTGNPVLDDLLKQEKELIEKGKQRTAELQELRSRTEEVKEMVEGLGLDTSGIDFDLIKNSDDMNAVREEAEKLRLLMGDLMGGGIEDLAKSDNLQKALESISGQAKSDMALAKEMAEIARTPGERDTAIKKMEEIQKAYEESVKTGIYESPFSPKRVLNAKGGRIGFADGDFVAPEDIITRPADNESMMAEYMAKVQSGELVYDPETKKFIPVPKKRRRQNTRPADNEEYMSDLMYRMKMNEMYGKKDGGRIGFADGGGGPKMSRRTFLGGLGAGLASLFMPRAANEVAQVVAKGATKTTPLTAEGMPVWFPSLVDKIRKEGKLVPADYKAVKSGEGYDFYEFTDPSLPNKKIYMTEYKSDGTIEISGRGDDMQIAELRFIPGEESIMVGEKGSKTTKNPNTFEADEFMKGPGEGIGDYENFGTYDELRYGVDSWANLVKGPEQIMKDTAEKFRKTQTNPNPSVSGKDPKTGEEFAKGGRVLMAQGGIASKFKERVHYGN